MQTVDYIDVLNLAATLAGLDQAALHSVETADARNAVNLALREAWEGAWWPELLRCEERYLRDLYAAATTYSRGAEVFHPGSGKYYHTLRASTVGEVPAEQSGSEWLTATDYWAESQASYSGADWESGTAYPVGAQRYYAPADEFYQCHTAHTSSGTLTPDATGANERWGPLVAFVPYVAYAQTGQTALGSVRGVWDRNPRVFTTAAPYAWSLNELGVQLSTPWPARVWVEYRLRPPRLHGSAYSATAAYTANLSQVYFSSSTVPGNYYDCLETTTAGQSPASHPTKWARVDIPRDFLETLARVAAGVVREANQEFEAADRLHGRASAAYHRAGRRLFRQQQARAGRMVVLGR